MHAQRHFIANEADVYGVVLQTYFILNTAACKVSIATEVATIVSELAMNIVKYAGVPGYMMIKLDTLERPCIDILAEDHGCGIADIDMAMRDHFSSHGTLGVGLPGVKRLADAFQIQSSRGMGTKVHVRKWLDGETQAHTTHCPGFGARLNHPRLYDTRGDRLAMEDEPEYAVSGRPCIGESVSGDGHFFLRAGNQIWLDLIDVLGHGQHAHVLARSIEKRLAQLTGEPIENVLTILHGELRGTLGAAVTLIHVNDRIMNVAGVGNIHVFCVGDGVHSFVAQPGIVGSHLPNIHAESCILPGNITVVMTTDGISEHMDSRYLIDRSRAPVRKMAIDILSEYGKFFDDATCLVWKSE